MSILIEYSIVVEPRDGVLLQLTDSLKLLSLIVRLLIRLLITLIFFSTKNFPQ